MKKTYGFDGLSVINNNFIWRKNMKTFDISIEFYGQHTVSIDAENFEMASAIVSNDLNNTTVSGRTQEGQFVEVELFTNASMATEV